MLKQYRDLQINYKTCMEALFTATKKIQLSQHESNVLHQNINAQLPYGVTTVGGISYSTIMERVKNLSKNPSRSVVSQNLGNPTLSLEVAMGNTASRNEQMAASNESLIVGLREPFLSLLNEIKHKVENLDKKVDGLMYKVDMLDRKVDNNARALD